MRNKFKTPILCFIIFSMHNSGYGQEMHDSSKRSSLKSIAGNIGGDILHVFSAPFRMRPEDGLTLLALTAVTSGFVTLLDNRIDENFIERDDFYLKPAIGLAKIGDGYDRISSSYVLTGLSASMFAGGLIFKNKKLLETARLMVESFLISGAITQLGKRVFGRARPYTGRGPLKFEPFKFNGTRDNYSFPSGHTTSAFSMMTVLAKQHNRWWIKIAAYTFALSVALQRLDSRNHWGADVVMGGAVGYWVGGTLVNRHKNLSKSSSMRPYIGGSQIGIMFSL